MVGLVQGFLGGLVFANLGIEGAVLVWVPAAVILMVAGDWGKGLVFIEEALLLLVGQRYRSVDVLHDCRTVAQDEEEPVEHQGEHQHERRQVLPGTERERAKELARLQGGAGDLLGHAVQIDPEAQSPTWGSSHRSQ